jgi:hypothetical protein
MCKTKSKGEIQVFAGYLISFFDIFVNSSFEYFTCHISQLVGDAYFILEKKEAMYNYCYAYILAEKFQDGTLLNSLAAKIRGVEMLYLLNLLYQGNGDGNSHFFDNQLHLLRADSSAYLKLVRVIEDVGIYFLIHCSQPEYRPKTEFIFYDIIEKIALPHIKIEEAVKVEVTLSLTNTLRNVPTSPVPYTLKFRETLQSLRRSFEDFPEDSSISLDWSICIEGFLKELIEDVLETIGKPRIGIEFAVVVMGSFAREELSLYSDLEMAIIYRNNSRLPPGTVKEYVSIFGHLLWLRIVGLCEDNSRISRMNEGMMLDSAFSFSPFSPRPLIFEVDELVGCYPIEELVFTNQFSKMRFLWGTETFTEESVTVFEETKGKLIQLIGRVPNVHRTLTFETLNSLIAQYENFYDKDRRVSV